MSHPFSTPAIRVSGNGSQNEYRPHGQRSPSSTNATSSTAIPMSIPGSREAVPPPLPPPKYIGAHISPGQDPGWQWGNTPHSHRDVSSSPNLTNVKPGSSLLSASLPRRAGREDVKSPREAPAFSRRSSQNSISHDLLSNPSHDGSDDESRTGRPSLANFRLQSETELGHRSVHTSSQAYDKSLLSKIGGGGPKTPTLGRAGLPAPAVLSRSVSEVSQTAPGLSKHSGQLKPLSMPDSRYVHPESPSSRWPQSAVSPRHHGFRSPLFEHRLADTPSSTRNNSMVEPFDEVLNSRRSHRPSVDQSVFLDPELMEDSGMRELDINDRSPAASDDYSNSVKGTKRRASSPPSDGAREGRAHASGPDSDLYHRRSAQQVLAHRSPPSRYQPAHGSLASASSLGIKSSFASTASFPMSMASSHTSHGGERSSPGLLSPIDEPQFRQGPLSPYPAASHTRLPPMNQQEDKVGSASRPPVGGLARMQGLYLCECCPKKPKRFESQQELDAHMNEKQYVCQFCPNRFKNKNEAERHQNSLHLRRHSWSCAALSGVYAAFHPSSNAPSAMDVCGFCGLEFPNPPDWNARAEHLCQIHKFGECNQSKKFFRADHFRQHLKHSHAGTSGKWTNMLETACMKEEAPPIPLSQQRGKQAQALASQATHALSQINASMAKPAEQPSPPPTSDTSQINPDLDNL